MARGTLHASKPEGQRRRRNAPAHDSKTYTDGGAVYGEPLAGEWDPEVIAWWEDWRRMPHVRDFERTDWRRLRFLAFAVQKYLRNPGAALLSEIRLNEERLGATIVDRMRARIVIERDTEEDAPPDLRVVSARDRFADRL
jgi:hypothetical protein